MKSSYFITYILYVVLFCCLSSCIQNEGDQNHYTLSGKTMGTSYHVKYIDDQRRELKPFIDSILVEINKGVSTYDPTSTISKYNAAQESIELDINQPTDKHMLTNYWAAKSVWEWSDGYFDPTCAPLVNYWGFGYTGKKTVDAVDSIIVDSLLQYVGMENISLEKHSETAYTLKKTHPKMALDFSAIAKGYGVDMVCEFLQSKSIENYMVEIGGEVYAKGHNFKNSAWKIGINTPSEDASLSDFEHIITLDGLGMATSGNYRNYREVRGEKYGHQINPKTGYPIKTTVLSTTILSPTCQTADALATATMVMPYEKSYSLINESDQHNACYIIAQDTLMKSTFSRDFNSFIIQ